MKALFEINQRVVCVDSKPKFYATTKLIEGKEYIITDIKLCICGQCAVGVGIPDWIQNDGTYVCDCGRVSTACINSLYYQDRFVRAEDNYALEEQIHEAIKGIKINLL